MTGIEYPTVTVDGRELTVKFSFHAQYLMSLRGIDLRAPLTPQDPAYLARRLAIFACAVAESANPEDPAKAPQPEYWASRIDLTDWGKIERALNDAVGKAAEELRAGIQAVAPPAASLAS